MAGAPGGDRSSATPRTCRRCAPAPSPGRRSTPWRATDGADPTMPRWMPDGKSILFVRFEPDAEGFLHPDLFLWTPEDRLRSGGSPSGPTCATPTRRRTAAGRSPCATATASPRSCGWTLRRARSAPLTEPSGRSVYDRPRVSPDGRRVAFARHREGSWRLVVLEIGGGTATELAARRRGRSPLRPGARTAARSTPVVGLRGFIDLWAFPVDGRRARAAHPHPGRRPGSRPAPDGSALFYLSLEPDGFDLRRLPLPPEGSRGRQPALRTCRPISRRRPAAHSGRLPEPFAHAEVAAGRAVRPGPAGAVPAAWRQRLVSRRRLGAGGARRRRGGPARLAGPGRDRRAGLARGRRPGRRLAGLAGRVGLPSLPPRRSGRRRRRTCPAAATCSTSTAGAIELCASRDWQWSGGAAGLGRPRRSGTRSSRVDRDGSSGAAHRFALRRLGRLPPLGRSGGCNRASRRHSKAGRTEGAAAPGPAGAARRRLSLGHDDNRLRPLLAARLLAGPRLRPSTSTSSAARRPPCSPRRPRRPHRRARPAGRAPCWARSTRGSGPS